MTARAWILAIALTAMGCGRAGPGDKPVSTATRGASKPAEVILSAAQQADGMIRTARVHVTDEPELLRVAGRIVLPDTRTWRVGVRTDGLVSTVAVGAGDVVHKGQILGRYHADELRDMRAKYWQGIEDLDRARSAETLAQRNVNRMETLLELKAASVQQVDQAHQDLASAHAATRSGEIEVARIRHLLEHDLQVSADTDPEDELADEVPIVAPATGYILERRVTPGRAIHTEDDAFVIGDLSQVWMLASVRQEQLGAMRINQPVRVSVAGIAGQDFEGTITNLGQQLDPETRTMQVRITLSNTGNHLRPEMLATAEIPIGDRHRTMRVASDAVQQIDGQDVVFVRTAPDRFSVRPVQAAGTSDGQTAITRGLQAGDDVVVDGSFILKSQLLRSAIEESD